MRRGRLSAAALVVAVLLAGCSDGDGKQSSSAGTPTTEAGSGSGPSGDGHEGEDGDEHAPPTLVDPATGKQGRIQENDKYTAVSPPPQSFRSADLVVAKGDMTLSAQVQPGCVEHGQKLTTVFKSEPGITVVAQIKWPNDQFSGLDNTRGTTGSDGTMTWTVDVKPTALYGVADLQAAAIDERPEGRSRKGTSGNWEFVVAPPGRC